MFMSFSVIPACHRQNERSIDLAIINGSIVDGSGAAAFRSDLAIVQDTIVKIGRLSAREREGARQVIDASGLVVSPGFIDIHSHSDWALLADGSAQSKIRQGVTTEILGESRSAGPVVGLAPRNAPYGLEMTWDTLGGYLDRLQEQGISLNVGSYVGATQVRLCVLGEDSRDPTDSELEQMKSLVEEAMSDGAFGLSSALLVPPNTYITTEQLVELARVVKPYAGIYSTHIRSEGLGIHEAIEEALEIGERAQVPVDVIHLKVADRRLWGQMKDVCSLIEDARARGLTVTANQYPYIAGQNNLVALVPPWAMEGGREEMLRRLSDGKTRKRIERDLYEGIDGWFNHYLAMGDWSRCVVASVKQPQNKKFEGKSIAGIAELSGKSPASVVFDLLLEENGSVPAVYFLMNEEDVRWAMRTPWVSFGSDGVAVRPEGVLGEGNPHPRWYGTFPRILGKYVREEKVLTLEEAIRKMTSLNAEKLGLRDRGLLEEGYKADVTMFDPERVIDRATFEEPHQYPLGIEYVIVNGVVVLEKGDHLGTKPGQILRKTQEFNHRGTETTAR
jgi:N-acyl-D-aspartate/D-glutamate deacylase